MSLQIIMMFQWGLTLELLTKLYEVIFIDRERAYISKGFLEEAKAIANTNVAILISIILRKLF
jgi:hypothetical protein